MLAIALHATAVVRMMTNQPSTGLVMIQSYSTPLSDAALLHRHDSPGPYRVWAPLPGTVALEIDGRHLPMHRSADGWWTADRLMAEGASTEEGGLKRTLGPMALVALGISACVHSFGSRRLAKAIRVSCPLAHQYGNRSRGADSPRSASPMGPAPTREPRMALPLATVFLRCQSSWVCGSGWAMAFLEPGCMRSSRW